MKLRKWLSLLLVMALAFTMVSQSGVTVSATELSDTSEVTEDTDDSVQGPSETDAPDQEQQDLQEAEPDAEQQMPGIRQTIRRTGTQRKRTRMPKMQMQTRIL